MTTERIGEAAASLLLIGALVFLLGAMIGAWIYVMALLAAWGIIRALPIWWPSVRTASGILFGDRYTTSTSIADLLGDVGDDMKEELIPAVKEAARKIHNWGSRTATALLAVLGLFFMWISHGVASAVVFVFFGIAVVVATSWPAIKRRWEERPK